MVSKERSEGNKATPLDKFALRLFWFGFFLSFFSIFPLLEVHISPTSSSSLLLCNGQSDEINFNLHTTSGNVSSYIWIENI
jgi:hypothetical protein